MRFRQVFVLFFSVFVVCSVAAAEMTWIGSESVVEEKGFRQAGKEDIERIIKSLPAGAVIKSYLGEGRWWLYQGNVDVLGHFCNSDTLIIDGNLTVRGSYEDYDCGQGIGVLVVTGNVNVQQHFLSFGGAHVNGTLTAGGLIFGDYNDFTFAAREINAKGAIFSDKSANYKKGKLEFIYDDNRFNKKENIGNAARYLIADVLEADDGYLDVDYQRVVKLVRQNKSIFRDKPAPASLAKDIDRVIDDGEDMKEKDLLALVGKDVILDRLIASMPECPKSVREKLKESEIKKPTK